MRQTIGNNESDLIKTTAEHCLALSRAASPWTNEYALRVVSASLRFLLIDENLPKAWSMLGRGGPIVVEGSGFKSPPDKDVVAFCGGAEVLPEIPTSIGWGNAEIVHKIFNLKDFLTSACISVRGTTIRRRDVVKYVANTRGGTHYDPRPRKAPFEILRELESNGLTGLIVDINGRNLVHHELASVIKAVLDSQQVKELCRSAATIVV